jgi:hypothetical protein
MGDMFIGQEYFCSFEAAVLGSFYGKRWPPLNSTDK